MIKLPLNNLDFNPPSTNANASAKSIMISAREAKVKENFYKGCVESLLMERKDRTTVSGQNKMNETLNKLLLNQSELAKWLLLKRVNEITARMILISLKPGQ